MKKFILKTSIIFLLLLLLFRFTVISLLNKYEQKLENYTSSSKLNELKREIFDSMKKNNEKENILDKKDALVLGTFIKKILNELDVKP